MAYGTYQALRVEISGGIAWVTIDHPPINLFDRTLIVEMDKLGQELEVDDDVRAVVFQSANPEFFIAHADVELILQMPDDVPEKPEQLQMFHQMVERYRTMPKATIGKIAGIARGGGSEFLLSLDMRFGAIGKTCLGQPEVGIGILPGGSGTQRLPRLVGRARALEIILGCADFTAELAEQYGYINRALPAEKLDGFVEDLARRIASYPAASVAHAKRAVDAAEQSPVEGLLEETHCFNKTLATDDAKRLMKRFIEQGGQTRDVELNLPALLDALNR
jgi:enoyl-CoA hydratase/carnithine racemase